MQTKDLPETLQVIFERRSCRAFKSEPIPQEHLDLLVEALRWAPSAGNRQPWHFYLVKSTFLKEELVNAAYGQTFLVQVPVVFVICAIPDQSATRYGKRGRDLYAYQDTAAAVQNLLLTATALGYGSCWVGAFDEEAVSKALELPAKHRPVAMIPLGKPAEKPETPKRFAKEQIVTIKR